MYLPAPATHWMHPSMYARGGFFWDDDPKLIAYTCFKTCMQIYDTICIHMYIYIYIFIKYNIVYV